MKRHVLVIDDDLDLRDAISGMLKDEGFEVTTAVDGMDALRQLGGTRLPDAILLDLMMPGTDGHQFRELQRADPRIADVPVIAMTAAGAMADAQRDALGVDGFLYKPFKFDRLLALIDRVAPRDRQAR